MSLSSKIDVSNINLNEVQSATEQNGQIGDHVYGNKNAKVVLVEYGDFQCPGCASAAPTLKAIKEKYGENLAFIFRHKPLVGTNPNALSAAATAEAAGLQGKFWEMHDKLFENQQSWGQLTGQQRTDYFVGLAESLALDVNKFKVDIEDPNIRKKIDFDSNLANKAGITGTPALFLNGESVDKKKFVGDKLVDNNDPNGRYVWSDVTAFENLILLPELKAKGAASNL